MVALVALVSTAAFGFTGWLFATNIDATYTETVDKPFDDRDCEQFADMANETKLSHTPESCASGASGTRTVDVGDRIVDSFLDKLPLVFLGTFLGWLLTAVGLHLTSKLAGSGSGGFGATLAVVGWSTLPAVVQTLFGVAGLWLALQGVEFASDPEVVRVQVQRLVDGGPGLPKLVGTILAVGWQGYIWTGGLREAHDLARGEALFASGAVAVVLLFASVL